jgi:hypothetical protein
MVGRRCRRTAGRLVVTVLAVGFGAARANGEETVGPAWFVGTQVGMFGLHHEYGRGGTLRVGRDVSRHVALDIGFGLAGPEGFHFVSSDLGLTVRLCDHCRVTPFIVGNAGLLLEAEWGGPWFGGGAGLAVRIGAHDSLSVTVRAAVHDGKNGPTMVAAVWTRRFASRQGVQ